MARFDRQIKTALRQIKKNGKLVKWRIIDDPATLDPSKPWKQDEATPVDEDVYICFLPIDRQTLETFGYLKGTVIPQGATMGLMGATSFEPNLKDIVLNDGETMRIDSLNILAPNGQKILYTIIFK